MNVADAETLAARKQTPTKHKYPGTREFDRHELMQSRGMDGPRHSSARKLI
jgi:hypothetical protein